jgi:hypothetical protein
MSGKLGGVCVSRASSSAKEDCFDTEPSKRRGGGVQPGSRVLSPRPLWSLDVNRGLPAKAFNPRKRQQTAPVASRMPRGQRFGDAR